jgi:hypothetical protein
MTTALVPTTESSTTLVPISRHTLRVIDGGTNRGGRETLPHLADFQRDTKVIDIHLVGVDPIPLRAQQFINDAQRLGLHGHAREAKIEDVIAEGIPDDTTVLLHIDTPQGHAAALELLADTKTPALGALYAVSPVDGQLHGFRYVFAGNEHEEKRKVAGMFRSLAAFTGRGGYDRVWGEHGRSDHRPLEPLYRAWAGNFVRDNLAKLAVGVPSNNHHIEMTRDGRRTLPVVIVDSPDGWSPPFALGTEILGNPLVPILRGDDFAIAETRPDGARFHFARQGKTDGRLRVNGCTGFDHQTMDAVERAERERQLQHDRTLQAAERARQDREVREAVRRAEQKTITRRRPLFFTD